jgi:hypothetical protein
VFVVSLLLISGGGEHWCCGCAPCRWTDDITGGNYRVQAVFQLRIRPTTYRIGQQTIFATEPIDPTLTYKNSELEWYTTGEERGAILLTALVVRVVPA